MKAFPDRDDDTLTASPASARVDGGARSHLPGRAGRPGTGAGGHDDGDAGGDGDHGDLAPDELAGAPLPLPPRGAPFAAPARARRNRGAWLLLLVLALAAAGGWYYWKHWRPAQVAATAAAPGAAPGAAAPGAPTAPGAGRGPVPRTPVVAVAAQVGDVPIVIDALGTAVPTQTAAVKPRVAGLLERVHFKEGDLVKEGQLLAEIDPRQLKVQLAQAEGQLARDRAQLENARVDLRRYETLFKQDSIARQQVDTQRALVRQYEGMIQVNESQVDNARLQLSHARVTAPIGGRVGLRQVDAGNMVTGAEENGLVVITQVEPISVLFSVPQDDLPKIIKRFSSGEKLPVKAFDRTQQNLLATGVLVSLDNLIDPATGTIKLRAEFANSDRQLFPNQFVNARLELDALRDVITVPSSAIQRGSQGMFVYVVKEDRTVALRPVTLGPVDGQRITLATGVQAGELVVVDGVDRLREGAAVELIERPDFQAAPPAKPAAAAGAPQRRRPAPPR
jgi:multidrug efflux system membrane fusion protein